MGLVKEGNDVRILSDILGTEDHLVIWILGAAGTAKGVTALQMDIKTIGITEKIMRDAQHKQKRGYPIYFRNSQRLLKYPASISLYMYPNWSRLKLILKRLV